MFHGIVRGSRRLLVILPFMVSAGCDGPTDAGPTPTAVRLNYEHLALNDGASDSLVATVLDQHGSELRNVQVGWSSSDSSVASVNASGVVSAHRPGNAQITASVPRNGGSPLARSATVTVRPVASRIELVPSKNVGAAGTVLDPPIRFRVLDRHGSAVAGILVEFVLVSGGGSLSAPSALTDSLGYASVRLNLGLGPQQIDARIAGTPTFAQFFGRGAIPLKLEPDSLQLAATGCVGGFLARLRYPSGEEVTGQIVDYSMTDSTVVSLQMGFGTGTYRGQSRQVRGLRVGSTQVIASYGGISDTARVRVLSNGEPSRIAFYPDPQRTNAPFVATGEEVQLNARVENRCGGQIPGASVSFSTSNPRVATVDASGKVVVRAAGDARISAQSGSVVGTFDIWAKDVVVLPKDTTVFEGDTVRYRTFVGDSTGALTAAPINQFRSSVSDPSIAKIVAAGTVVVVALQPGTVRITFQISSRPGYTTLRVVSRPTASLNPAAERVPGEPLSELGNDLPTAPAPALPAARASALAETIAYLPAYALRLSSRVPRAAVAPGPT